MVPEAAASLISSAMEKKGEWKPTDLNSPNKKIRMKERDFLDLVFRDGLKLTTNQMEPEVQFNSRRWQGYQVSGIVKTERPCGLFLFSSKPW